MSVCVCLLAADVVVSRAERSIAKNRKGAEQKQNRAEERGRKEKSKEKNRAEVQN